MDILTSFSPNMDLFAITVGNGLIKVWDTVKGRIQTEFADIASTETASNFMKQEEGHLSMDYSCMKWFSMEKKKKRKIRSSLLMLGTGSGDVVALDVSVGQLKWRINNCHPGGVSAVSFAAHDSHIYSAGADGMVCEIDSISGNLLKKFTAGSRPISALAISPDGKMIATAASEIKIFNSSSHKKLKKFSGHPGAVRCLSFSEDGRYVFSSGSGERYIAIWEIDGGKKKSASAFLSMDHPAIFLDSKYACSGEDAKDTSLCVFAISEIGACYYWHGKTIEDLRNGKPTRIVVHADDEIVQKHKGGIPNVFAGKLQNVSTPESIQVSLAYGFLTKPVFVKVLVHYGEDIKLNVSQDGLLLPMSQSQKSRKASQNQCQVNALDGSSIDGHMPKMLNLVERKSKIKLTHVKNDPEQDDLDSITLCMEDELRALGMFTTDHTLIAKLLSKGIKLDGTTPEKEMKRTVLSLEASVAIDVLQQLVDVYETRSEQSKHTLLWMDSILLYHGRYIISKAEQLLHSVEKLAKPRVCGKSLLKTKGRLQLLCAQIDKAANKKSLIVERDEKEDESEDEVDEIRYGVDDSQTDSDSDD